MRPERTGKGHSHNLFQVLGERLNRQDENRLTQCLSGLFNESSRFRKALADFLAKGSLPGFRRFQELTDRDAVALQTQQGFRHGRDT